MFPLAGWRASLINHRRGCRRSVATPQVAPFNGAIIFTSCWTDVDGGCENIPKLFAELINLTANLERLDQEERSFKMIFSLTVLNIRYIDEVIHRCKP